MCNTSMLAAASTLGSEHQDGPDQCLAPAAAAPWLPRLVPYPALPWHPAPKSVLQIAEAAEPTEYVRNRPRRQARAGPGSLGACARQGCRGVTLKRAQKTKGPADKIELGATRQLSAAHLRKHFPLSRLKRVPGAPSPQVGRRMQLGETTESTDLTHLENFVGPPGTASTLAQASRSNGPWPDGGQHGRTCSG